MFFRAKRPHSRPVRAGQAWALRMTPEADGAGGNALYFFGNRPPARLNAGAGLKVAGGVIDRDPLA